jgi:hypothetical protein
VPAHRCNLWKVEPPKTKDNAPQTPELTDEDELDPAWKFGEYFPGDPPEKTIHITVKAPGKRDPFRFLPRIFGFPLTLLGSGRVVRRRATEETDELYKTKLRKLDPPSSMAENFRQSENDPVILHHRPSFYLFIYSRTIGPHQRVEFQPSCFTACLDSFWTIARLHQRQMISGSPLHSAPR